MGMVGMPPLPDMLGIPGIPGVLGIVGMAGIFGIVGMAGIGGIAGMDWLLLKSVGKFVGPMLAGNDGGGEAAIPGNPGLLPGVIGGLIPGAVPMGGVGKLGGMFAACSTAGLIRIKQRFRGMMSVRSPVLRSIRSTGSSEFVFAASTRNQLVPTVYCTAIGGPLRVIVAWICPSKAAAWRTLNVTPVAKTRAQSK